MSVDAVQELEAMKAALTALEPLEGEGRKRAMAWLGEALGLGALPTGQAGPAPLGFVPPGAESNVGSIDITQMTPKQFMTAKRPSTDVERIACLAYFLTHVRGQAHFKTGDLTTLNTEAAGQRFGNASQAAANALNQNGYLAQAGKGNRQITTRGEALVEALPDREAVNAALAEHPKRARRAKRATKTTAAAKKTTSTKKTTTARKS
jgi:hypothetical protein